MKVVKATVEVYIRRNPKPNAWEIRYTLDNGAERMSAEVFETEDAARKHADSVLAGRVKPAIFTLGAFAI